MQLCAAFRHRELWPLILAGALLAGCHSPSATNLNIDCHIRPEPVHVGLADISIRLLDRNRKSVPASKVTVEANMSHPGMKPILVTALANKNGEYEAHLDFTMPGDWALIVQANLADDRRAEKQLNLVVREK